MERGGGAEANVGVFVFVFGDEIWVLFGVVFSLCKNEYLILDEPKAREGMMGGGN